MLRHWFRRRTSPNVARLPEGAAIYAIGDIHGRLDLLQQLLARIADDSSWHPMDRRRLVVFVGDYIDRGPASRGVVDLLVMGAVRDMETVYLRGNHEQALLDFLDGRSDGTDWLTYGGLETLLSYGVPLNTLPSTPEAALELRAALNAALPASHVEFFRDCIFTHVEGDYVFVHAGVRPGRKLENQESYDLLWIRDDFLRSTSPLPGRTIVHGHTICDEAQDLGYRINVDTGAFVSGHLTCLVLRDSTRRFLVTKSAR